LNIPEGGGKELAGIRLNIQPHLDRCTLCLCKRGLCLFHTPVHQMACIPTIHGAHPFPLFLLPLDAPFSLTLLNAQCKHLGMCSLAEAHVEP
jgi:hypothetical protein